MKTTYFALLLLAIAAFTGCAQQPQPASSDSQKTMTMPMPDLAKEEAAIRATDAEWLATAKTRDAAKAASFWSDDATLMFPGMPPVVGKKAILDYVTKSFSDPDFNITFSTDKIVVASSGDMAYETGSDVITFRAGKKLMTTKNNGVVVWKKQPDGQWKAAIDIGTPAPEVATAKK
jgi:uncharacterized protein (TIGR02246 family)